jgi:hypothetical protein
MANLKLIRVTGTPFSDACMGCIGIQTSSEDFEIIMDGRTWSQTSSFGQGYEPATKTDIEISWSTIYPHWTPEPGDKVIITQNYEDWANCKGTIVEEHNSYYKVKREDGCMAAFDSCEMILAPYTDTPIHESKPTCWKWQDLKVGDKVKIIRAHSSLRPLDSIHTIYKMEPLTYQGNQPIGVQYAQSDTGWPHIDSFEPYYEPKIKEETVTIKFLTEQQFREKGLWNRYGPKGWNSIGEMNKYLGRSAVIPKSSIGSNGSFSYEGWTFKVTDYIITEWILSKVDDFRDVSRTIASSSGAIGSSEPAKRLVIKGTSAASDSNPIFVNGKSYPVSSDSAYPTAIIGKIDTDPLSLYKQKPITIKAKPKSKLTTI